MIKNDQIRAIKSQKLFGNLNVRKIGEGIYEIISYNYGEEEARHKGDAESVSKYINQYYGYSN